MAQREPAAVVVVGGDDGAPVALGQESALGVEERRLGLEVVLEVGVEVEMVLAEVGERRAREPAAVDPVQGQGMAGDLHRGGVDPTLPHRREQRLQLGGLRGRPHARNDRISNSRLHRTDQSCAMPGGARARPRAGR